MDALHKDQNDFPFAVMSGESPARERRPAQIWGVPVTTLSANQTASLASALRIPGSDVSVAFRKCFV